MDAAEYLQSKHGELNRNSSPDIDPSKENEKSEYHPEDSEEIDPKQIKERKPIPQKKMKKKRKPTRKKESI